MKRSEAAAQNPTGNATRYAIIEASGSQFLVHEGDEFDFLSLAGIPNGERVSFDRVLLVKNVQAATVGMPYVNGSSVSGTVVSHLRGEKIRVATYRAKSRYRRVKGHRDELTRVKIDRIITGKSQKTENKKQ